MRTINLGYEISSFLHALARVKPPNKAGEMMEAIPMMNLTNSQWRTYQWFSIAWLILHATLMSLITDDSKGDLSADASFHHVLSVLDVFLLVYASFILLPSMIMWIRRLLKTRKLGSASVHKVRSEAKEDKGILSYVTWAVQQSLNQAEILTELAFAGFTWAIVFAKVTSVDAENYAWIKSCLLLFGWLVLLVPLRSYSPVYQLIQILKYIAVFDIFPWILLYMTINSAFAAAIQLQFQLLPDSARCVEEESDLKGILHDFINALYELMIVTSGLDTDMKHTQNLRCLFEYNNRVPYTILLFVTTYGIVSTIALSTCLFPSCQIQSMSLDGTKNGDSIRLKYFCIYYRLQRRCCKVMFLHKSVILSTGGVKAPW